MIEARLLKYFVAAAETQHIGRAAAVLHISQSPLSRQIRQLEEMLGLTLFERERQRIRITSAGEWLLVRARQLLAQVDGLEKDARRLALGQGGSLRIGFVKNAMWTNLLPRALREFRRTHADVEIELRNSASSVQIQAVRRGELDIGLLHEAPLDPAFASHRLSQEALHLVLPADHPLAKRSRVLAKDLDGADWVVITPMQSLPRRNALLAACAKAGFSPNVRFEVGDQVTAIGLVEAGMAFALLPASVKAACPAGVTMRRLPWLALSLRLFVVTRANGASPQALSFVAGLKRLPPPAEATA